jgi:hypothetical protein
MTEQERKAYEQKIEAQMAEWRAEFDKLKARSKEAGADTRAKLAGEMAELDEKTRVARKKLAELRDSSDDAWQDVKSGFESSWHALQNAAHAARQRFD